jgi:hypothetical protein
MSMKRHRLEFYRPADVSLMIDETLASASAVASRDIECRHRAQRIARQDGQDQ